MMTQNTRFAVLLSVLLSLTFAFRVQAITEYRAQWADAFHDGYLSSGQVTTMMNNVRSGNLNVIIPEVRVYSDAYFNPTTSYYPNLGGTIVSDGTLIACDLNSDPEPRKYTSFDPLATVIQQAHDTTGGKQRFEVWPWLVSFRTGATMRTAHPEWLTQTRDGTVVTGDFDPGHPGVQQQLYNVCMDIIDHYAVDGLNFDYIRHTSSTNGFNPISVARYNEIYDKTGIPTDSDAQFKQWRRDQITNVVRKVYLNMIDRKPNVRLSVDTITWAPGPVPPTANDPNPMQTWETNFKTTAAYVSCYQDWRSWMEDGIIDIALPMNYFRRCTHQTAYERWLQFTKDNQFGRQGMNGPGGYLNSIEDGLYQLRQTRDPSPISGLAASGTSNYSYAIPYSDSCGGNYVADPAGFCAALANGIPTSPDPLFPTRADIPDLPRWTNGKGHLKGTVTSVAAPAPGWIDGGIVTISGPVSKSMRTDGTGFYGWADLPPGTYSVTFSARNLPTRILSATIIAHKVTTLDCRMSLPTTAKILEFTKQPALGRTGIPFIQQPALVAKDDYGNVAESFTGPVTLQIKAGTGTPGASVIGTATVNAVAGQINYTDVGISLPGQGYVIVATSPGLASAESSPVSVTRVPTHVLFTTQPPNGTSNIPLNPQPVVEVLDAYGEIVTDYTGSVAIALKPDTGAPGAVLKGTKTIPCVGGKASFLDLSLSRSGLGYILVASGEGLASAESVPFDIAKRIIRVSSGGTDADDGSSWEFPMATIQAALQRVGYGDEIWVKAGLYGERVILTSGAGLFGGFAGTETSRDERDPGANKTTIDAGNLGSAVTSPAYSGTGTILDGFTLTHGIGSGTDLQKHGGGLLCADVNLVVNDCVFMENTVSAFGAGAYLTGSNATFTNCTFTGNTANQGGGLYADSASSPTITNCIFTSNTAGGVGGAVALDGGQAVIQDSLFDTNGSTADAGAVYVGGSAAPTIRRCTFVSNTTWGRGGALLMEGTNAFVRNNLFCNNWALYAGGIAVASGSPVIVGNTLHNNTSDLYPGGIGCDGAGTPVIVNNIIHGGSSGYSETSGATPDFRFNDVFANAGYDYPDGPDLTGANGNISVNPAFVNPAANDYRLTAESPLIDLGDESVVLPDETDLDSQPRRQRAGVDIGACEYPASAGYGMVELVASLRTAAGFEAPSASRFAWLNVVTGEDSAATIDIRDAVALARKVAGLDPNP